MATSASEQQDALILLRSSIANNTAVLPGASADAASASADLSLAQATHLHFISPSQIALPLASATRFYKDDAPVDLRSIFFAWQNREAPIPAYTAAVNALNEELKASGGSVKQLAFVERLDLITWLEGASEESDFIKELATPSAPPGASQVAGKDAAAQKGEKKPKEISVRLQEIYAGERKTGDRNSVLRGIKPTDFSHVRKLAAQFIKSKHGDPKAQPSTLDRRMPVNAKPARRPDPIILVSPSASALLRMSNIKSFLEQGTYVPPDSSLSTTSSSASILHISRIIPSIDATRPIRFIVVDSPEQFKPEYWARVVCVFTTGQQWQFKNYKWAEPGELFRHCLGVYVGWRGENVPDAVRGWGRGVMAQQLDMWSGTKEGRWRDREVVEGIWRGVGEVMRGKGWSRDSGPQHA